MISHFVLLIILFLSFLNQITSQDWNIIFKSYDDQHPYENQIFLRKGIFSLITIEVIPLNDSPKHAETTLSLIDSLESNKIIITPQTTPINTKESLKYQMYVGVKCNELNNTGTIISFKNDSLDFIINQINVNIFDNIKSLDVDFSFSTAGPLPENSYGLMGIKEKPLLNVDNFTIKFELINNDSNEIDYASIDDFIIPSFATESLFTFTKYKIHKYNNISDKIYFKVISDNKCFDFPDNVTITQTDSIILPSPSDSISSIIKSTVKKEKGQLSTLTVSMNIDYAPDVLKCALQEIGSPTITFDQLNNFSLKNDSMYLQYAYLYFEEPGEKDIVFTNISLYLEYKMMCILESPSLDENPEQFNFTIGYFEDADIKIELYSDDVSPIPSYCLTWVFNESFNNENDFLQKSLDYCNDYFIDPDLDIDRHKSRKENGCIECVQRNVTGLYFVNENETMLGMCIKSRDVCHSQYDGDLERKFEDLVRDLNSVEDIYNSTGFSFDRNVEIYVYIENDEEKPDKNKIKLAKSLTVTGDTVTFQIYTTSLQKVECYAMVQQRSALEIQLGEYDKHKFIIQSYSEEKQVFSLNNEAKNQLFNLILRCYNLPQFQYNVQHTDDFVLAQFNFTEGGEFSNKIISPLTCEDDDTEYNPQCVDFPQHTMYQLQTIIDLEISLEDTKKFRKLNPIDKLEYIQKLASKKNDTDDLMEIVKNILLVNDLLPLLNCKTYILYDVCRSVKQSVQNKLIQILSTKLNDQSILSELDDFKKETPGKIIKSTLITIFYAFNNPDSFNKVTTDEAITLLYRFYKNLNNIALKCTDLVVLNDIIRIYGTTLDNVFDLLRYNEFDNYLDITDRGFINDKKVLLVTEMLNNLPNYFHKVEDKELQLENVKIRLENISLTNNTNSVFVFDDESITLTIPTEYLKKTYNITYLTFTIYDFYPVISFLQQVDKHRPALSIRAYDIHNNLIEVKNLKDNNQIKLTFSNLKDLSLKYCYYRNDNDVEFNHTDIVTDQGKLPDQKQLTCSANHLGDFTIGSYDNNGKITWGRLSFTMMIVFAVLIGIIIVGAISIYFVFITRERKVKPKKDNEIDMDKLV